MSDNNESKPAHALGPAVMRAIGRELRAMYAEMIAEKVPERFAEILRGLDDPNNKGGDSMTLVLRKQHTHDRIEGQEPRPAP